MSNLLKNNFRWSWKPYLTLLLLFGFRIEFLKNISWRSSILTGLFTIITLTSIAMVNYELMQLKMEMYSYHLNSHINKTVEDRKNALLSSIFPFVGDVVHLFFSSGPYIIVFWSLIIKRHSKTLWLTLLKVQNELQLPERFYLKVRNECYMGLGLIILVRFDVVIHNI